MYQLNGNIIPSVHNQLTAVTGIQDFPEVLRLPIQAIRPEEMRVEVQNIDYYQALVNPRSGQPYQVVTDIYEVVPYTSAIDAIEEAIRKHPEFGAPIRMIKLHSDGCRMHVAYRFPECTENIGRSDPVEFQIGLWTSYDGSWPLIVDGGAYRLICTNGLTIGKRVVYFKHKHTRKNGKPSFDYRQAILCSLDGALERYADETGLWRKWVDMVVMPEEYEGIISGMDFGKKALAEVESEVEVSSGLFLNDPKMRTLTVWLLFNVLAQYITHKVSSPMRQFTLNENLRKGFEMYRN